LTPITEKLSSNVVMIQLKRGRAVHDNKSFSRLFIVRHAEQKCV